MTFFSGTDTATLREEGNKRNHFVSLIVNNAGTYTAGITRKVVESRISETFKYGTFDGAIVESSREYDAVDTIEWCNLEIIKEGYVYSFRDVDERLEEIKKNKTKVVQTPNVPLSNNQNWKYNANFANAAKTAMKDIWEEHPTLFDSDYIGDSLPFDESIDGSPSCIKLSDKLIHSLLLQLITGSVAIADESRIIPEKWALSMERVFDKRFENNMKDYKAWAEQFCEFLVYYPNSPYRDSDETEYAFAVSSALIDELTKLPENKYIKELINCLTLWTM